MLRDNAYASGILAALGAPLVMTVGFLLWQDHWKGSAFALNLYKCGTASLLFLLLSLTATTVVRRDGDSNMARDESDGFFPAHIFTARAVGYLWLSSTLGIVAGDWAWLRALQLLGAKPVILMDSLKPFLAAVLGWWLLGEELRLMAFGGIVLTVLGILVVSLEQTPDDGDDDKDKDEQSSSLNDTVRVEDSDEILNSSLSITAEEASSSSSSPPPGADGGAVLVKLASLYAGSATGSVTTTEAAVEKNDHRRITNENAGDDAAAAALKPSENGSICSSSDDDETNEQQELDRMECGQDRLATQQRSTTDGPEIHQPGAAPRVADCEDPSRPAIRRASSFPAPDGDPLEGHPEVRRAAERQQTKRAARLGYACSAANVVLDTYGSVLTKQYGQGMTVWEINLLRFGFAGAVLLATSLAMHVRAWLLAWRRRRRRNSHAPKNATATNNNNNNTTTTTAAKSPWYALPVAEMNRSSWLHVSAGVLVVTFLTPTLANYALLQIALGLALTLTSIGPLYQLPLAYLMQKQKPTLRSLEGAVLAVAGVAVLAFRGSLPEDD